VTTCRSLLRLNSYTPSGSLGFEETNNSRAPTINSSCASAWRTLLMSPFQNHSHNKNRTINPELSTMSATSTARGIPRTNTMSPHQGSPSETLRSTRRRSQAIAIKRKSGSQFSENDSSDEDNGYAAECEWATWRMYNRIVDHRQKHPVSSDYDIASQAAEDNTFAFPVMHAAPDTRFDDEPLEGEVFDLEL
jgi:hypothetical protein